MCYFLNVQFQGQRVKYILCDQVVLDSKFIHWPSCFFPPTAEGTNRSRENLTVCPISPLLCNYKGLTLSAIWQTAPGKTTSDVCVGNIFHLF